MPKSHSHPLATGFEKLTEMVSAPIHERHDILNDNGEFIPFYEPGSSGSIPPPPPSNNRQKTASSHEPHKRKQCNNNQATKAEKYEKSRRQEFIEGVSPRGDYIASSQGDPNAMSREEYMKNLEDEYKKYLAKIKSK